MKSRHLKVSYRPTQSHVLPLRMPSPFLRLQGRWLDQAGFAIGADVQMQVESGRLVLEVIDPQAETG